MRFDSRVVAFAMGHNVSGIESQAAQGMLSKQHKKLMDQWASFVTGVARSKGGQ